MAEFGDPIPGRDESGSKLPNDDDTIPNIPEATTDEEIELTELRSQLQESEDVVEV